MGRKMLSLFGFKGRISRMNWWIIQTPCLAVLQRAGANLTPLRRRALDKRDDAIRRIEELRQTRTNGDMSEARKLWKQETSYHRRSLAETAMFRYKTIFGQAVRARTFDNQTKELCLNVVAMNKMTRLGIPSTLTKENAMKVKRCC